MNEALAEAKRVNGRKRVRFLRSTDVKDLFDAIDANPNKKRVRSYSADGFVANSYDYPAEIVYCEGTKQEDGAWHIVVAETGAKRPRGEGSLLVIQ